MKLPFMFSPKSLDTEVGKNPLIQNVKLRVNVEKDEDREALLLEDRREITILSVPGIMVEVSEEVGPESELPRTQKGLSSLHILIIVTGLRDEAGPGALHLKVPQGHVTLRATITIKALRGTGIL